LQTSPYPPHLPPCPTRRSSDLTVLRFGIAGRARLCQRVGGDLQLLERVRHHPARHVDRAAGHARRVPLPASPLPRDPVPTFPHRSEEHTSELQSRENLVCRLLL